MRNRIDDHTKHRIITMRENGEKVTDISDELGISVSLFSKMTTKNALFANELPIYHTNCLK